MDASAAAAHLASDVDPVSRERLEAQGLTMTLVTGDADREAFIQVVARGFLDPELTAEQVREARARGDYRRMTGVYDPAAPSASAPVATSASWLPSSTTRPLSMMMSRSMAEIVESRCAMAITVLFAIRL